MENENTDLRTRKIMERVRKIWTEDAINLTIVYWQYMPEDEFKIEYSVWIAELKEHFYFKSFSEIEDWLYKKELLFKQF